MVSRIDRYRACAATCAATEYGSKGSVRQHNAAADRMRAIVAEAYAAGPSAVEELIPLLVEPPADQWLAFQLLELGKPEASVAERCLSIIRRIAVGSDADALGAEFWLRDWAVRQAEPQRAPDRGGK